MERESKDFTGKSHGRNNILVANIMGSLLVAAIFLCRNEIDKDDVIYPWNIVISALSIFSVVFTGTIFIQLACERLFVKNEKDWLKNYYYLPANAYKINIVLSCFPALALLYAACSFECSKTGFELGDVAVPMMAMFFIIFTCIYWGSFLVLISLYFYRNKLRN